MSEQSMVDPMTGEPMSVYPTNSEHTECYRIDPMMRCDQADSSACCQSTPNMVCPCECHERAH